MTIGGHVKYGENKHSNPLDHINFSDLILYLSISLDIITKVLSDLILARIVS